MPDVSSFFSIVRRNLVFWFGGIWFLVGSFIFLSGIHDLVGERQYRKQAQVAQGVVLEKSIKRAKRGENSTTKHEITYRFTTAEGKTLQGTASVSVEEWEKLEEGERVQVSYLPGAPESNRLAGEPDLGSGIVAMIMGGIFGSIGGFIFFRNLRRALRQLHISREGIVTEGTVLEVEPSGTTINRVRQWQIRYSYRDPLGQTHQGLSGLLSPEEASVWQTGDTGAVRFDQSNPQESVWIGKPEGYVSYDIESLRSYQAEEKQLGLTKMESVLRRLMRGVLRWSAVLAVVFIAVIAAEAIEPLKDLELFMKRHQSLLLAVTIGITVLGFILLMGPIISLMTSRGKPMSHKEVEEFHSQSARPTTGRASSYRIWGKTGGVQAHDEFSLQELKQAWRTGALWQTSLWQRRFLATVGGLMMVFGMFGIFFVIGPAWVKLLVGSAMLYALARLTWGFLHA